MPTYEYRCDSCSHEFEKEQRITADALKKCPSCGKMKLVRLIGAGNFILKGSGWYKDLYSSPAPKKAEAKPNETGESGKADSGKADSGKADSGKADSGKADSGKADSGKADSGKADSGRADSGRAAGKKAGSGS